jgi:histone-lysine N-methyltransferase SETMAR
LAKQQIRAILLYEFKMGRKAAETTRNINQVLGQGTVNERRAQLWFKEFRNGDESLEVEGRGRFSAIDDNQLRAIIEADPCKTTKR